MKLPNKCKYFLSSFIIVACCLQQSCRAQSTTVRPYKFGFTIDEQQHRKEQRDERGIVMGEFGFITADGIYHVTVYATDEQGRFRILAMKNYPYESPPKTVEVMVKPKIPPKVTTSPKPLTKHNFNTQACSGCFLTNGDNKPKDTNGLVGKTAKSDIRPLSKILPNPSSSSSSAAKPAVANKIPSSANSAVQENTLTKTPLKNSPERSFGRSSNTDLLSQEKTNLSQESSNTAAKNSAQDSISKTLHKQYTTTQAGSKELNQKTTKSATQGGSDSAVATKTTTANSPPIMDIIMQKVLPALMGKNPKISSSVPTQTTTLNNKPNAVPSGQKPSSGNAGVDKNKKSASGSAGSSAVNGDGDLYRFKYNLDYHGHTETGKRNGNKEGSYYAIGDDNVERTIEYVANEFGYQPRIRWRKLNSNEIKSKENTLKDYEFVWFK